MELSFGPPKSYHYNPPVHQGGLLKIRLVVVVVLIIVQTTYFLTYFMFLPRLAGVGDLSDSSVPDREDPSSRVAGR